MNKVEFNRQASLNLTDTVKYRPLKLKWVFSVTFRAGDGIKSYNHRGVMKGFFKSNFGAW